MPGEGQHRSAEVVLFSRSGEALLQLRDDRPGIAHPNVWGLPGGAVEPGESIEAAARREVWEETGYVLGELTFVVALNGPGRTGFYFVARYDGLQPLQCNEGQALRFVAPADLPHPRTLPCLGWIVARAEQTLGTAQAGPRGERPA